MSACAGSDWTARLRQEPIIFGFGVGCIHWALVCETHRSWLDLVPIRRLRELRRVSELAELPRKASQPSALEHQRESALIDGALWLVSRVIQPLQHPPPWGKADAARLAKILRSLIQVGVEQALMSPAAI